MRALRVIGVVVAVLVAVISGTSTGAHLRITTTVTWDREIAPIVQARCLSCHGTGVKNTMPLATYVEARPWARAIKHQVLTRRMPIWHAARGYGDFMNDPSLSPFEIALISAWVDGGAPKSLPTKPGAPAAPVATAAPPPPSSPMPGAAPAARALALRCGDRQLQPGQLLGLKPQMATGGSMKVVLARPDGTREILGWFRDFDPSVTPTYWLRTPAVIARGSHIIAEAPAPCMLTVMLVPVS